MISNFQNDLLDALSHITPSTRDYDLKAMQEFANNLLRVAPEYHPYGAVVMDFDPAKFEPIDRRVKHDRFRGVNVLDIEDLFLSPLPTAPDPVSLINQIIDVKGVQMACNAEYIQYTDDGKLKHFISNKSCS